MRFSVLSAVTACCALRPALAALYTAPSQLPNSKKYDYIIVGGGTAGNVIATRLSENASKNVLVIEAGPSNLDFEEAAIPFVCVELSPNTPEDWNYTTVPQPGLNERSINYPRGRLLGGSSSINYMIWNTGSTEDWNRYATVTGDSGWSWNSVQPIIKSIESLVPPADHHDTTGQVIPSLHGTSGPVGISLQGYPSLLDNRTIATTKELPAEFPYNEDMNSGFPLGLGWPQFSVADGTRVSSATAYLEPALNANRSSLDVLINTQVTKLIQTGTSQGAPVILGVQFAQSASGPFYAKNATTEVIVSAGSIGSPQLLMLSGIGDKKALAKFSIKSVVNLPDVGQNMQDHTVLPNAWSINASFTPDDIARNATLFDEVLTQWATTQTGQFATPPATNIGWFRIPNDSSIYKTTKDPSPGPNSPHYEFIFAVFDSFAEPEPTSGHYMIISTNLFSPTSRGSVTLASTNPFDFPLIDPALLDSAFDIFTITEAVKAAQRFMAAPAWDGFQLGQYGDFAGVTSDAAIEQYARNSAATVFHPAGTAYMSPYNAPHGVTNPDLTVKGTKGLRVVDASIFPYIPSMHPQGFVYVVAERVARLIEARQ
ncbi:aryl-alcohol-oxidase from pleurotus Eryingii [Artomyces pyxidatus]|uniref:Aryl-alcohol-oxidase from pleurotus Eryingii n=1 Tax=Artomyces pyxidatus TaxID=48021 RepID=A0ACB8T531_9AGAM|nr:aryl-alcohol-oxidase from pleurotus Eryingii [Artomyces pyxidatus]